MKKKKYLYNTEREFIIAHQAEAQGRISSLSHIISLAKACINAQKEFLKETRCRKLARANARIIKELDKKQKH